MITSGASDISQYYNAGFRPLFSHKRSTYNNFNYYNNYAQQSNNTHNGSKIGDYINGTTLNFCPLQLYCITTYSQVK